MSDVNANINVNIDSSSALAEIKRLQREISLFYTSINKGSATAAASAQNMQRNLVNSINSTGKFEARIVGIQTASESFTTALEKNKLSMGQYFKFAGGATKTFGKLFKTEMNTIEKTAIDRVKKLQTQYIKLGRDASGAMKAIAVTPNTLNMNDYTTKLMIASQKQQIFNQLLKQGTTNLLNFGKNTQWAGRQLMVGFTVPLAMLGSVASKSFMKLEEQAVRFRKVYGDMFTSGAETEKALQDIQQLAKEFTKYGLAVEKTMKTAADAAQAGLVGDALKAQVTEATRLAVLGDMEQEKALETTIALQNAFRVSTENLSESINFLNAVENQTVLGLDDIAAAIPRVGPIITELGGDVKDLAFFLTAMREGGVSAEQGANALKSGLGRLINPTKAAKEAMGELGINLEGIIKNNAGDLRNTVLSFANAIQSLDPLTKSQAVEKVFGKFQFARILALLNNITSEGSQAARVLDLTSASVEELAILSERELGAVEDSLGTKFRASLEKLQLALAPIGEAFLKVFVPVVEFVGKVVDKFNNLSDGVKGAITAIVAVVGGLAPIVLMGIGLVANGIANALKFILKLKDGYMGLFGQSKLLGLQTEYVTDAQLEAQSVAASLDQTHSNLIQTFTVETEAVKKLADAYARANIAGQNFAAANPGAMLPPKVPLQRNKGGIIPGSGNTDTVPAMLTPGEFVINKKATENNLELLKSINAQGQVKKFNKGGLIQRFNTGGLVLEGSQQNVLDRLGLVQGAPIQRGGTSLDVVQRSLNHIFKKFAEDKETQSRYVNELISTIEQEVSQVESARSGGQNLELATGKVKEKIKALRYETGEIAASKKPEGTVFAHGGVAGKNIQISQASELADYVDVSGMDPKKRTAVFDKLQQELDAQIAAGAEKVGVKITGAWGQSMDNWINNALSNAGFAFQDGKVVGSEKSAKAGDLAASWDKRNIEMQGENVSSSRWDKSLKQYLGKSQTEINDMAPAIKEYDSKLKELLNENANKYIMDSNADIEEKIQQMAAKRGTAFSDEEFALIKNQFVSMEDLELKAREHLSGLGGEISNSVQLFLQAIQQAESMVGEIRVQGAGGTASGVVRVGGEGKVDKQGRATLGKFLDVGDDAVDGVSQGLTEGQAELRDAGEQSANVVESGMRSKKGFDTSSPSKKTRKVGQDAVDGLVLGLNDGKDEVALAGQSLGDAASTGVKQKTKFTQDQIAQNEIAMYAKPDGQKVDPIDKSMRRKIESLSNQRIKLQKDLVNSTDQEAVQQKIAAIQAKENAVARAYIYKNSSSTAEAERRIAQYGLQELTAASQTATVEQLRAQNSNAQLNLENLTLREKLKLLFSSKKRVIAEDQAAAAAQASALAEQRKAKMRLMAGRLGGAAAMASSGLMMASMMPGQVGETAQKFMGPMMALTMMLPLLTSKFGVLLLAVAAIVGPIYLARRAFDKAQDQMMELTTAVAATNENLQKMSEFAGTVSASELMNKRRSESMRTYDIQAGKTTFGQNFVKADVGEELTNQLKNVISSADFKSAQQQLFSQLSTSVAAGVVTTEQARSIALSLGEKLGNYAIGLNVAARLASIMGPNGENLLQEPLKVRMQLLEENRRTSQQRIDEITRLSPGQLAKEKRSMDNSALAGAASGALAGAAIGAMLGGGIPGALVGAGIGTLVGGIGGAIYGQREENKRKGEQSGAIVALQKIQLEQSQQIIDSLDVEYQKRLEAARLAGDMVKYEELQNKYIQDRAKLIEANAQNMQDLVNTFRQNEDIQKQLQAGAEKLVTKRFKDDPLADVAKDTKSRIGSAGFITAEQKYVLTMQLATTMDPLVMNQVLGMINRGQTEADATMNIFAKFQTDAAEIFQIQSMFIDKEGKPIEELQTDFIARISTMSSEEVRKELDLFREISKLSGVIDANLTVAYFEKNKAARDNLSKSIDTISKYKGKIELEILGEIDPKLEEFIDKDYFKSLDQSGRDTYVRTITTLLNVKDSEIQASDEFKAWLEEPTAFPAGGSEFKNRNGLLQVQKYIEAQGQLVTMASRVNPLDDSEPTGTDSGSKKDPFEDILRKLKQVRDAAINAEGGVTELMRVLGGAKNIKIFQGMEQQLTKKGFSKEFTDYISSLDKETRDKLVKISKTGKLTLTETGAAMRKAFDEAAMGDFQVAQKRVIADVNNTNIALRKLVRAGFSAADAYKVLENKALAAAIAKEKSNKEIKNMVINAKKAELAMAKLNIATASAELKRESKIPDFVLKAEKALGRAFNQVELDEIINNKDVQLVLDAVKVDKKELERALQTAADRITVEIKNLMITPQGRLDLVNRGTSAANQTFDAYERIAQSTVDLNTIPNLLSGLDETTRTTLVGMQEAYRSVQEQNKIIKTANEKIADLQYEMQAYQDQIKGIQDKIDDMNRDIEINFERPIAAMQEQINDLQREIELQFARPIEELQKSIDLMQRDVELRFDRPIQEMQEESNRLSNDLTLIDKVAEKINEKYDKQQEALSQISSLNSEIIAQEKTRVSLADALTQGDISAAAQAALELRDQQAQSSMTRQSKLLDSARDRSLRSLRSESGMTREDIEERLFEIGQSTFKLEQDKLKITKQIVIVQDQIYELQQQQEIKQREIRDIQDKIYELEELKEAKLLQIRDLEDEIFRINKDKIKPLQDQIDAQQKILRDAERARDVAQRKYDLLKDTLKVAGKTADEWKNIEAQAALAAVQSEKFKRDMEAALAAMQEIIRLGPLLGGSGSGPSGGGTSPTGPTQPISPESDAIIQEYRDRLTAVQDEINRLKNRLATEKLGPNATAQINAKLAALRDEKAYLLSIINAPTGGGGGGTGSMNYLAEGGLVPKPNGTDVTPAMLTPGEFVISRDAVKAFGLSRLQQINQGTYQDLVVNLDKIKQSKTLMKDIGDNLILVLTSTITLLKQIVTLLDELVTKATRLLNIFKQIISDALNVMINKLQDIEKSLNMVIGKSLNLEQVFLRIKDVVLSILDDWNSLQDKKIILEIERVCTGAEDCGCGGHGGGGGGGGSTPTPTAKPNTNNTQNKKEEKTTESSQNTTDPKKELTPKTIEDAYRDALKSAGPDFKGVGPVGYKTPMEKAKDLIKEVGPAFKGVGASGYTVNNVFNNPISLDTNKNKQPIGPQVLPKTSPITTTLSPSAQAIKDKNTQILADAYRDRLTQYRSSGGSIFKARGTDTVPAMLTPGEFVIRKYAVKDFGLDKLKAINSGTYNDGSVYNYNLSLNVKSDSNADEIAQTVIAQIKRIEGQRIRGNRF